MKGGNEASDERKWLRHTLYLDIAHFLGKFVPGKRVIDAGCGTGELALYLQENGFNVVGIDPSVEAVSAARQNGCVAYTSTIESFANINTESYDAVVLLNVLEHVRDPVATVEAAKTLTKDNGIVCIVVPNDFTNIQRVAQAALNRSDDWWVAIPDHINYFNTKTLEIFMENMDLELLHLQGDFPMELFLLMGEDYIEDAEIGVECHKKRVNLELAMPAVLRRTLYQSLACIGIGRACMAFGRKR